MKLTPVVLALCAALATLSSAAHAFDSKPLTVGKAVRAELSLAPGFAARRAPIAPGSFRVRRPTLTRVGLSSFRLYAGVSPSRAESKTA